MVARIVSLLTVGLLAGCKDPPQVVPVEAAASTTSVVTTSAPSITTSTATIAQTTLPPIATDAGITGCTALGPRTTLATRGPYSAAIRMGAVDLYATSSGAPVLAGSVHIEPRAGTPPEAGTHVFCMNSGGEIRRFRVAAGKAESDNFIARAHPGTSLATADLGGHPVVAYLRDHKTSEGEITEAFIESDDGTETHLSEDGTGATSIALAPRGAGAVAIYVDARRGMAPIHARAINVAGSKLTLGKDVVLFVGGTAETYTHAILGVRGPAAYALVPVAHDLAFGVGVAKIEGEPVVDSPVVWSDYPNGLDPAPIAATFDAPTLYVARIRPSAAAFGSPRILEIGQLDAAGAFTAFGVVPASSPVDVAIAGDGAAGFVLAYSDATGGYSQRLKCP